MVSVYVIALIQAATGAGLDQAKSIYQNCVTAETVRLGQGNSESADTILRAVRFKCEPSWQALQASFPSGTGVRAAEMARVRVLEKWRGEAEGAAIAALLEARSTR